MHTLVIDPTSLFGLWMFSNVYLVNLSLISGDDLYSAVTFICPWELQTSLKICFSISVPV